MPYFAGLIYSVYPLNVYMGIKSLHIHIDKSPKYDTNLRGYEDIFINDKKQTVTGIYGFTPQNIDWFLEKYFFDYPNTDDSLSDFLNYQDITKKLLLTEFPKNQKIDIEIYTGIDPGELTWLDALKVWIDKQLNTVTPYLMIAAGLVAVFVFSKVNKK
jgi:hypothetical protein